MDTPSGTLESSPDPLNDSSDATIALLASSAVRRVTRSQRAGSHFALEGTNSVRSTSISPRKQVFRLDVGNDVSPQRLRVTVETEDHLGDSEPEGTGTKMEDSVSRRLFKGTPSMPAKPTPRRRRQASSSVAPSSPVKSSRKTASTTTTKIPLRGLSDDEYAGATPKRPRGRPRRSGTPLPKNSSGKRVSVSPSPSTPATGKTPRRNKKTGAASSIEGSIATADTPLSVASGRATSKRTARAASIDSDVDSIGDSRPRKRGRPRRLAMAPDEMAAIAEQQEDIDLATNFYASIENDEQTTTDQAPIEDASGSSPTPTTLSSVDLVKVQTPIPDFGNASATDYNEDNYLSPIQEVSGIGGDIAAIDDGDDYDTPRASSNMEHAHAGDAAAANANDRMNFAQEPIEDYNYEANEADDNTYGDEHAAVADNFSATHNYNEDLATGDEPVPQSPSPTRGESPAMDVALTVETDNTGDNGEISGLGGTEVQGTTTIAEASQAIVDPRSDPTLPFGYTPAKQRPHAHFSQSELTPSASDSDVDTVSVGAAMAGEEVSDFESEADEAATVKFRDQDTIAKGEDFSMIGMESLQTSINMSRSELPEMGETTSRIVSRTLESIRQGNQGEEEDSALSFFDFIQQSDPSTPRSTATSENPQSAAGLSRLMHHPPQSSPTFSQMGSSKKKAEPLGKLIARKSLQQAQSPAVPRAQLESTHVESSQLDTVSYEDSFSEIPESVLQAAVPQTANTYYFSQQQADLTGRISQSQQGFQGEQPVQRDDRTEADRRPQLDAPTSDGAPVGDEIDDPFILQSEQRYERSHHTYQSTISGHDHDTFHHHSNDGDEEVEQAAADITSSPPIHPIQLQQQVTEEPSHSHQYFQAEAAKSTPVAFTSPRQPPKAPYVGSPERVDRLALPAESFRPSLSPIVRAGRVLQSVTSDPPSPNDNEGLLRSPFRRSINRDTNSPSIVPQNGFSSPDPEQTEVSLQLTTEQNIDTPELRRQNTATPSQPPLSASRRLWTTALAPLSGLKSLVVNGAQIISPQIHLSASAAPVVESPVTPGATKRSAEAAQLVGSDRGESSSRNKRLRLSALPEAAPAARIAASEAGSGSETGRSWRSLVFREGSVAGSITSFASRLISRNAQNPQSPPQNDAEPESASPSNCSPSNVGPITNRLGMRTDEIIFSNDNEMTPATPYGFSQHSDDAGDAGDDDDFDIWAIEASRPTPAPAARPAVPSAPPKALGTARDPRLVRLAASQIKKSVRKRSLGASMTGSRRYGVQPEEEEEENEDFSLLDTGGESKISSQTDNSSKRPAPFNLDDFFSSPVAVPRMLPPTSEKNIRLNEQSRLETLERLLERDRRRDAQQVEMETGEDGYDGEKQTATTAGTTSTPAGTQQAVQQPGQSLPTDNETVAENSSLYERQEQSGFNVAFYGEPPASVSPPRNAAGAEEEEHEERGEIGSGDDGNSRNVRGMPRIRNVPRRRSISKSQQARIDFLRAMKEPSANSGPENEQSPPERAAGSGEAVKQSIFDEEIPSTPLQNVQRRVALPSSSPEDEALGVHRLPYSRSNAQHVDDGADEEPPMMSSPFEALEEAADMPEEQSSIGESHSQFEEPLAAASESVFFEENLEQPDVQEFGWGSWEGEGQEASYVESESSFLAPVLKPLPARSASPTKSCLRSPAKAKTPGRVVEFASSTMGTDTGEQVIEERANMQQAELQFAEHFALDTENRIPTALGPPAQSNAQPTNDDGDIHMMDVKEVIREEGRHENERGYEVDEELSEMMLSDAHQISTPLAFVYTPKVQAGRPYFHAANIPRARWQAPPAIALPPPRDWTLDDWLSMNRIVQDYRHLGPLAFHRRYMPERGNGFRSPGGTLKRPSHALYRKVVHTENEGMLIKDWHLDIVDAFYIKAGRIWNHHYLLRRLFSLFIGEARHGILLNQELGSFYALEGAR